MFDDEWLPVIGAHRLVVITRDSNTRYRPAEKLAWIEHRVRGFVLTGRRSQTTVDSRAILDRHWSKIEALVYDEPDGPWMCSVTESCLRRVDLG